MQLWLVGHVPDMAVERNIFTVSIGRPEVKQPIGGEDGKKPLRAEDGKKLLNH